MRYRLYQDEAIVPSIRFQTYLDTRARADLYFHDPFPPGRHLPISSDHISTRFPHFNHGWLPRCAHSPSAMRLACS